MKKFKTTLSMKEMMKIFDNVVELCKTKYNLPICKNVSLYDRLSNSQTAIAETLDISKGKKREYLIVFSKIFFDIYLSEEFINKYSLKTAFRNILMHELIHTISGCMNHGKKWKKYIEYMNTNFKYKMSPTPYSKKNSFTIEYPF